MKDRFLINKWTIMDRLDTLRRLSSAFSQDAWDDFDRELFSAIERRLTEDVKTLTNEVRRREDSA